MDWIKRAQGRMRHERRCTAAAWMAFEGALAHGDPLDTLEAERAFAARIKACRASDVDPTPDLTDEEVDGVLARIERDAAAGTRRALAAVYPEE